MAKLQSGTRIYGTANVDTILYVNTYFVANSTGVYSTGTVNSASYSIGNNFIVNTSQLSISGITFSANGSVGNTNQVLTSNSTGGVYWAAASSSGQYTSRVNNSVTDTSVTPDSSQYDIYAYTALASGLTINASTFLPTNGTKLMFRIKDNGTAQTLTWTTTGSGSFRILGTTLPTTTTVNKVTYIGCVYNSDESYWDVIAVATQA